jgi:hypothetical protein
VSIQHVCGNSGLGFAFAQTKFAMVSGREKKQNLKDREDDKVTIEHSLMHNTLNFTFILELL